MLSDNIRYYRKENNMSQDELAEKLNVSRQSVSLWENGQTQPTIDNIIALTNIFNISANDLLGDETATSAKGDDITNNNNKKGNNMKKKALIITGACFAVAIIAVLLLAFSGGNKKTDTNVQSTLTDSITQDIVTESDAVSDTTSASSDTGDNKQTEPTDESKTTTQISNPVVDPETKPADTQPAEPEIFDLFEYCKNFAIDRGELNGDYTIYQQPSSLYGGYENEFFSVSYWGDSDMVEFCLHCPLDDTYSINFYLRMRGGYNGTYEYLSSRYYRDTGESVRSASGTVDPSEFSQQYPLYCDEYTGTVDKQNDFMEETRVGICDLINCLKSFAEVEQMECGFDAFGFVNF